MCMQTGLQIFRALAKPYLVVQQSGIAAATEGVLRPKSIVHKADLTMALASWESHRKVLQEKQEEPSQYCLQEGMLKIVKASYSELEVDIKVDRKMAEKAGKKYGYKNLYELLMAKGLDWQQVKMMSLGIDQRVAR